MQITIKTFSLLLFLIYSQLVSAQNTLKSSEKLLDKANSEITNIDTASLENLLIQNDDLVLIDVRLSSEIDQNGGAIKAKQNVNIPRGWLEFRVIDFVKNKDTPIVVYCGTNIRSPLAAKTLMDMGYTNVKNYSDGAIVWNEKKLPQRLADNYPESILFNKPQKIIDGVYSAIGETWPSTIENSGHNNNLSFIIGNDAVLVMNAGGSYLLAQALHNEIKKITNKPVKYVVLENAQGHAILGSNYWQQQGATIIGHQDTADEIKEHKAEIFELAQARLLDKMAYTKIVMPDKTFTNKLEIDLGNKKVEVLYLGPAHGPGDIIIWLPNSKLVITGDVAFHQRLLPIFETTNTLTWLKTWEKLAALKAKIVIPGHGSATNMQEVSQYTKDYLLFMRAEVNKLINAGKSSSDAYKIDQTKYKHLDTYEQLYKRNATRIFAEMEFE